VAKSTESYRKTQLLIVLVSLLLHTCILLFLFYVYSSLHLLTDISRTAKKQESPVLLFSQPKPKPKLQPVPEPEPKTLEWASTNPGLRTVASSSQRHALVGQTGTAESEVETEQDKPDSSIEEDDQLSDMAELIDAIEMIDQKQKITQKAPVSDKESVTEKIDAKIDEVQSQSHAIYVQQQPEGTTKSEKVHQKDIDTSKNRAEATQDKQKKRLVKKRVSPQAQQMMQRIASSFMHEARDQQEHVVTVIGDPRKLPTAEQIKRERYIAKLQECLYASYVTLRSYMPRLHEKPRDFMISIRVHRDGSADDIKVMQSSTHAGLDQFYVKVFQDASRSFPPLPPYFPYSYYEFRWLLCFE
jgi:hypothetical protein